MENRSYVITGAAGGMGAVAARLLVERGLKVLGVDRDAKGLDKLKSDLSGMKGEVLTCVADLEKADDVLRYVDLGVKTWGKLDGAFHIAGWVGSLKPFADAGMDEFDRVMAANTRSVWYGMKALFPVFLANGGGVIVNTGSYAAIRGGRFTAAYASAKHAIVGLSRAVAVEYAASNIRVNVVAPGTMDTSMARTMAATISPSDPDAGLRRMIERIPRQKMATTLEVAQVGVWLLLDAPAHLSGQVIPVDGARSAG
jgi:NAD(P)-dependent dehydrogenase (short-subunit alcohol dehydrogenase family)